MLTLVSFQPGIPYCWVSNNMESKNTEGWFSPDDDSLFSRQTEGSAASDLKEGSDVPTGLLSEMTNVSCDYGRSHSLVYAQDDIDIENFNKYALAAITTSKDDLVLAYKTSGNKVEYIRANKDLLLPWAQTIAKRQVAANDSGSVLTEKLETALSVSEIKKKVTSARTGISQTQVVAAAAVSKNYDLVPEKSFQKRYRLSQAEIKAICKKCKTKNCDCTPEYVAITSESEKGRRLKGKLHKLSIPERDEIIMDAELEQRSKQKHVTISVNVKGSPQQVYQTEGEGPYVQPRESRAGGAGYGSYISDNFFINWTRTDLIDYRVSIHAFFFLLLSNHKI